MLLIGERGYFLRKSSRYNLGSSHSIVFWLCENNGGLTLRNYLQSVKDTQFESDNPTLSHCENDWRFEFVDAT